MRNFLVLSVLLALAVPASAEFEGILHMKMSSTRGGGGGMRIFLSKAGVRSEMDAGAAGMTMRMTSLVRFRDPDKVYLINDREKTYSEFDAQETRGLAAGGDFKVKKLGKETVLGYECDHVLVTGGGMGETELWTTREIMDFDSFAKLRERGDDVGYAKALRDAGVDGFPVKSVHRAGKGDRVVLELVRAEKMNLPASRFEIPSGYRKASAGMGPAGAPGMPPEAMKGMQEMRERMKDLPPEQREMMEKMMKEGAGPPR